MTVIKIQNAPSWWEEINHPPPTVIVQKGDANWDEAYQNWLDGKNPTDSKEWKKGVIAVCDWSKEREKK